MTVPGNSSQKNFEKFKDNPRTQKAIESKKNLFEKLLAKNATDYSKREGWKRLLIDKKGQVYIRCQSMLNNSNPPKQCPNSARKKKLLCQYHIHSKDLHSEVRKMKRAERGIYNLEGKHALKAELELLGEVSEEELKSVNSELVLTIALLRKYLRENTDRQIKKSPGRMLWILDKLVNFKRTKWEMSHAPEVSFSIDQVNFVLSSIRVIVLKVVKDEKQVEQIGEEMAKLGIKIKSDGFSQQQSLQSPKKGI